MCVGFDVPAGGFGRWGFEGVGFKHPGTATCLLRQRSAAAAASADESSQAPQPLVRVCHPGGALLSRGWKGWGVGE